MTDYEDIIDTKWPQESIRPKMPLSLRAKIFLPFAALNGYEASLENTRKNAVEEMSEKSGKEVFDDLVNDSAAKDFFDEVN